MPSNRWKYHKKREQFIKDHSEFRSEILNATGKKMHDSAKAIEIEKIARSEIGYSDKTVYADIINGLKKSYKTTQIV